MPRIGFGGEGEARALFEFMSEALSVADGNGCGVGEAKGAKRGQIDKGSRMLCGLGGSKSRGRNPIVFGGKDRESCAAINEVVKIEVVFSDRAAHAGCLSAHRGGFKAILERFRINKPIG